MELIKPKELVIALILGGLTGACVALLQRQGVETPSKTVSIEVVPFEK